MHVIPLRESLEYPQHLELRRSDKCIEREISECRNLTHHLSHVLQELVADVKDAVQNDYKIEPSAYAEAQVLLDSLGQK